MQRSLSDMSTSTAAHDSARPAIVPLMGLGVAAVSERATIAYVLDGVAQGHGGWICPANLDVLRQWRDSAQVRDLVAAADLVVADGMPLVWAGELQGSPLPGRVAGSSLSSRSPPPPQSRAHRSSSSAATPGTADAAVAELSASGPDLRLAGTLCPPFGFERDPGVAGPDRDDPARERTRTSSTLGLASRSRSGSSSRCASGCRTRGSSPAASPSASWRARSSARRRSCSVSGSSGCTAWRRSRRACTGATCSTASRSSSS